MMWDEGTGGVRRRTPEASKLSGGVGYGTVEVY